MMITTEFQTQFKKPYQAASQVKSRVHGITTTMVYQTGQITTGMAMELSMSSNSQGPHLSSLHGITTTMA